MTITIALEPAKLDDAERLYHLINEAYRGQKGWTKETEIVVGDRLSIEEVKSLIRNPRINFLVARLSGAINACICIEEVKQGQTCFGTFAVSPEVQNRGIGKQVLRLAENFAMNHLKSTKFAMTVISQREELISYYERQGYKRTGEIAKYPVHLNVGIPKVKSLTIENLEKFI